MIMTYFLGVISGFTANEGLREKKKECIKEALS